MNDRPETQPGAPGFDGADLWNATVLGLNDVNKQTGLISRLQDEADLCRNEGASDIAALLDAATEAALDDEASESDLHDMVRWAYSKLRHASYGKQEDALMLDRMKLLLEHGA